MTRTRHVKVFLWSGAALSLIGAAAVHLFARSLTPASANTHAVRPRALSDGKLELDSTSALWSYLDVRHAQLSPALEPLPVPGRVGFDPARAATVAARLPGKIEQVNVSLGDHVVKGQRLLAVRSGSLAELEREIEAARNLSAVKKRLAERAAELYQIKAVSEREKLAAEAEQRDAELSLRSALSRKESLQITAEAGSRYWLSAPRTGTIVELNAVVGLEVFPEMQDPLVRLAELDEVVVLADVPEQDVSDVRIGEHVMVTSRHTAQPVRGHVEKISAVVDPDRRTVQVHIRVDNHRGALRPNAYVQVLLLLPESTQHVRVPSEAVVTDSGETVVFVADGPRLTRRRVRIGRERAGETEILEGLEPGVQYIARGALLLLNEVELAR